MALINSGYIKLNGAHNDEPLYIKARHIISMGHHQQTGSYVWTPNENFWVKESIEEITELLDAVHPDFL